MYIYTQMMNILEHGVIPHKLWIHYYTKK